MRLIYLSIEYCQPIFSGNGAIARMQVEELLRQGHTLLIFCGNELGQQFVEDDQPNRRVIAIPIRSQKTLGYDADFPTLNREMLQYFDIIKNFKPDAIIVIDWHFRDTVLQLKSLLHIPIIYQFFRIFSRDPAYIPNPNHFISLRQMEQELAQNAEVNIHLSKDTADWAREKFATPTRILYPSLKPSFFQDAQKYIRRFPQPINFPLKLVTFVRISPEKEIERMILFLIKLSIPWTLKIMGEAVNLQYFNKLQSLIKQYSLETKISFDGRLDIMTLLDQISKADAYIHPARYEPFGISIMEAGYIGLPIILDESDKIGAGEILQDERSCLRLNFESPEEANSKLLRVIQDANKWYQIGQNAHKIAQNFNIEKNIHQLIDWIQEHK